MDSSPSSDQIPSNDIDQSSNDHRQPAPSPKPNNSAKRGIAAAIAAFEKGPDKSAPSKPHTPLLKRSVRANNSPQPPGTPLQDSVRVSKIQIGDQKGNVQKDTDSAIDQKDPVAVQKDPIADQDIPVGDHNIPVGDHDIPVGDHDIPVGDHDIPVGDQMGSVDDQKLPIGDQSSTSPSKPTRPAKTVKTEPKPPIKKSEPVPAVKAHPRASNVNATTTTKPPVRTSASVRPGPTRTAVKPSANPTVSPGAARRTSLISNAAKAPLKTAGTAATTTTTNTATTSRRLPVNNTAPHGRTAHSSMAPAKKMSIVPGATTAKASATTSAAQPTAELETKLSQAQLDLASKSEQLAALEAKLEESTKNAVVEQDKLNSEIQTLNAKLEDLANNSLTQASDSQATVEATKAELESAKVRIVELEEALNSHQQDQTNLIAKQAEASSQVSLLEVSIIDLKKQLHEANASNEIAITEISTQHTQELASKLEDARREFKDQKSALESRLKQLESDLQNSENEQTSKLEAVVSEEIDKKIQELNAKHADELESLNDCHAAQMKGLTSEHEAVLRNLRETFEAKVAEAEKAFADLKESTASLESTLKEQHAHELASTVEETRVTVTKALEASIAFLKEEHATAVAQLEAELGAIKEAKSLLEQEQEKVQNENKALQADQQALEDRLTGEIEALKTENIIKLGQEYQRAKDELNEANLEQLKTFRQSSQESTDQLLLSHKAELDAVKSALQSDFASEKAIMENELAQAKLELTALHSDLSTTRNSHQELSDRIQGLTAELESTKAALSESESKANEPVKSTELEELQGLLKTTQDSLNAQKLEFERLQEELRSDFEHARELHSIETSKHIEEKTLLQNQLASTKEEIENDRERIKMSQALIEELTQTIEQETSKKEKVEVELRNLQRSPPTAMAISPQATIADLNTNTNLIELHEAHNLKILELTNEVEKWKDIAMKKEDEIEEIKFRVKFLEDMIQNEDEDIGEDKDKDVEKDPKDDHLPQEEDEFVEKPKSILYGNPDIQDLNHPSQVLPEELTS